MLQKEQIEIAIATLIQVVFMQNANEECNVLEIEQLVRQVGIDTNDQTTQTKLNELQKIKQLNDEIATLKEKLKECKNSK